MRLKINIHILISFALSIFSFMTFWLYSNLFGEELFFYLGIPFSLLIFCLFYFLAKPSIERVVIVTSYSKMAFLSLALTVVSIFLLTFIPPYEGSIINWVDVPLQNWLRGLASLLLTSFFPGYFLLKIADKNKTITGGALIVLSNLLSMFVMFLLGFSTLLLGNTVSSSSVVAIVVTNLLLATLYYLIFNIQKDKSKSPFFLRGHDSIILLTLCVVMIGAFAVMLFGMPLTWCDMWFIHSQALELSKGFPAVISYPYLFSIYLSLVFAVSGLHSALTMQLLYVFSFMPVLGFYSMVKQWFTEKRNEKTAAVATFFSIFLGFGSLYLLYSKVVNPEQTFSYLATIAVNKTYDSYMRFPFAPYMVVLRWSVGLPVLFSLLYLLKNESCKIRSLLFTLLISIGYLGHAPEVVFFIPLLVVWTIFFQPNSNWKVSFSILLGFLIVGIIDFLAPTQIYVLSLNASTGNNSISLPYAISVLVVTLLLGVEIAKHKGFSVLAMRQRIFSIVEKTWRYAKWLLLYSYLFCITVWICVVKDYNLWLYDHGFNFVSFFIFPIRWGAIGLITILSIFFYFSDIIRDKVLSFFMLVFAIGIALEQVCNYFPIYYADIARYAAITCIGGSIIAAYGIERMLCCFTRRFSRKRLVSSFLLFLLILTGALSTTVYYTHMTYLNGRDEVISNNELQALEYIKNNLSSEESVLTFTYASAFKLGTFAGISFQSLYPYCTSNLDRNIVNYVFLETENPYILTYMLGASNTRYIYVAKEDATLLSSKHFLINSFLKYLPEIFKSPDVTLYEVPRLIPPSHNLDSSLGVIHLFPSKNLLSFDGVDDYVEFEDNYSLRPTSISIELRFKKDGNFGYKFLVDKSKNAWVSYAFMGTYDNKLRFIVGIDSGITERYATTTTIFKDDEWYHVIGVYDGKRIVIYVNGELEDETTYEESKGIYYDGNNPLRIGTHVFEANSYFKGSIDYIRIYNRTISKDEINYSYKNNIPKNVTDLILYLDFEGNLKDDSGNENDGINHGATFVSSSIYSENDSFMALFMATLESRYSILYADDLLTEHLDMYLSNYTHIILTSDPKVSFPSILNWVSAGHTLVVFNTNRDGFFARLLDLNFSSGNLINVKEFNSGKIVYVDIYSLLMSCEEHRLLSQTDFINMVKNAFYIPSYNASTSTIGRPGVNFNITYGEFEVIGNLSLFTDLLVLKNATILNPNFTHSKTFTTSVYGRNTLNIQNATLFVFPSESYLLVKPENNLIQGQILVDSKVTLQISDSAGNSTIMNETQKVLNFQAEELLAKLPIVNASGEIIFKSLYRHVSPYVPIAGIVLQEDKVQGNVKFGTMHISNPLTIFSMFQAEGNVLNLAETTPRPTIPWAEVLSSPYNLAFNTIFLLGVAIYFARARIKIKFHTFISLALSIFSLLTFLFLSLLFEEQLILYLSIPFASGIFFFFSIVLNNEETKNTLKITYPRNPKIFLIGLATFCMLVVLFVPAFDGSMLEWMKISPLNWLRYLSSLLLTSFLPGYFLLKILYRKDAIDSGIVIVLSYLLSLFITFLAGFSILLSANSLGSLELPIIITTNIFLIIIYYITNREKARNYLVTVNWLELGLVLSLLTVITACSVIVMINNAPLTSGDMRYHYGTVLDFSKGFPVYGGKLVTYPGGYLFAIYLSVLFVLSGIPPALAEQGLYLLSFLPLLAFYSSIKVWFSENKDKRLPLIATMLSILLGFGGLYALYLKFTNPAYNNIAQLLSAATSKTYDIYMRILYLPDVVAPLWNIGLPVLFMLLYFLKKDSSTLIKATIIPVLVALGYMGHTSEVIIFIITAFIYTLFFRKSSNEKIGPYVVLGLVGVALLDLAAPVQVFVLSGVGTSLSLPFVISLILAALTSVAELVKDRCTLLFSMNLRTFLLEKLGKSWRYGKWVLIYVYLFFFVTWLTIEKDFNLWAWSGYAFTPFFVLPLRLGAVGLLAIISIVIHFKKIIKDRSLLFFLLLILLGFILEQTANYYPNYYTAYRYGTLTFVGSCVIAAYGIINIIDKVIRSPKRKMTLCVLLSFLMISGLLSTTLFYINASYYSINSKIPQDELNALDYIQQNIMTNASVLTFTDESANSLRNFAGINVVQDAQRWSELLLSTSNPYIITYVLSSSNIKYIYVAQRDVELLNSSMLNSVVKYFRQVFKNNYVAIYEVPPLTAPSSRESFGVLDFSPSLQKLENNTWIDDSFTEGWYPYRQYGEVKNYESEVGNGLMEISVTSNQSGNIWASYALSGLALNTTIYSTLFFRYHVENNFTWFTFQLWNSTDKVFFYVGHLSDIDFTTKVLTLPANQTITRIEVMVGTAKDAPADTTAHAYIDYIKFSAPTSTWKDDNFLRDWAFYKAYGNISDWSAHSNGDILKMNVTSNQSGDVWVSYSLPLALKTKDSVLSFRYKVDNDYTWFTIQLRNASNQVFFYRGHLTDRAFTTKSYFLPDGQTITRVEIIVETTDKAPPQTSAAAQIDYIEISQQPFSNDDILPSLFISLLHSKYTVLYVDDVLLENIDTYLQYYTHILLPSDPPFPVESLLKWGSSGNTLTVFNMRGNGFFANLLGINSSSPLLSINNINSGKVFYINSFPTVAAGKESEVLQPEFLAEIKEYLPSEESVPKVNVLPVYNSTSGSMQIKGDLKVDTDILILQGTINLPNSPFSVNESTEIKIYGKTNLTIKNATLLISPSESYMLFKPESYPIEGEVLVDGFKALIVADANVIYNSDIPISFKFKTTALSLYARLPSINVSGTITFDELDVHAALYVPLAGIVQQRAEIQGSVKFDTMWISNSLTIFSMFQAEGKILNLAETTPRPTIPWVEVLSSPYNLAFNTIFLLGVAIYFAKKRKAKPTLSEEIE